jgi:hypothetical protein
MKAKKRKRRERKREMKKPRERKGYRENDRKKGREKTDRGSRGLMQGTPWQTRTVHRCSNHGKPRE